MEKKFDAVKMVREIRNKHYEETKELSWEEQKKIINESAKILMEELTESVNYKSK